jgi:hypothetical protein
VGETFQHALLQDGWAFFTSLLDQITQVSSNNVRFIRPAVSDAVRAWWQSTTLPVFHQFSEWHNTALRNAQPGTHPDLVPWGLRLSQLRREAVGLGLVVAPSDFFNAIDAAIADSQASSMQR